MLSKVVAVVNSLNRQVKDLRGDVERLKTVKPVVKNGRDGKDAPPVEELVAAVLAQIPEPEKIDIPKKEDIVAEVLQKIPKPRDGRDGQTVSVSDVAAIVLAKLPKPKDGRDAPDLETIANAVRAQVQDGRDGERGERGERGAPGKDGLDGVSVTDVEVENNKLYVWLDGVKKLAGKINVAIPFNPGGAAGGGSARLPDPEFLIRGGFFDYNDLATQTTPINVPGTQTDVVLTNDEQGAFTNKNFPPPNISDLWDADANVFDWSQLKLGDTVDIRLDLTLTTTQPNQLVIVDLVLAQGAPGEYRINYVRQAFKNAASRQVLSFEGIYMGDLNTLNNPAQFKIRSDSPATAKVNGWYVRALIRG